MLCKLTREESVLNSPTDKEILLNMIVGQYLTKLVTAALDTPFCYMLVALIKNKREVSHLSPASSLVEQSMSGDD